MILSRSLARVRPLTYQGIGLPYVLDYKRGVLKPYLGTGEWDQTKDGRIWKHTSYGWLPRFPTLAEVRAFYASLFPPPGVCAFGFAGRWQMGAPYIGLINTTTYTVSGTELNSAYTYGSAGAGVGIRLVMLDAKTFDTVYFWCTSYNGTAANVNDVSVELRDDSSDKPGSTLHDSVVKDPASATGWIAVSGFTFAGSANTVYWIAIADPDGNGTDDIVVSRGVTSNPFASHPSSFLIQSNNTSNGFSTISSVVGVPATCVIKYSDGSVFGNPYGLQTLASSSTNRKGLYVSDGFTESFKTYGIISGTGAVGLSGAEIYSGSTIPGGSTDGTFGVPAGTTTTEQGYVGSPVTLSKETPYRFVLTCASSAAMPPKLKIGTGADANLRKAMLGGGNWYYAEANGTTDWSNDDSDSFPKLGVLIEDQVSVTGGGGAVNPLNGLIVT